jgi:hypothetical protein
MTHQLGPDPQAPDALAANAVADLDALVRDVAVTHPLVGYVAIDEDGEPDDSPLEPLIFAELVSP